MGVFNRVPNGSSFPIIWMAFLGISSSSHKRSHETLRLWALFLRGDPVVFSADFVMLGSCAKGLSSGETDRRIIAWPLASAIVKTKFSADQSTELVGKESQNLQIRILKLLSYFCGF